MADLHPYQPESTIQGMLYLLHQGQHILAEIAGLPAVSSKTNGTRSRAIDVQLPARL